MERVYKSLDNILLYCARKTTQACNYTFGWSRKDLANLLESTAPAVETYGHFYSNPVAGTALFPVFLGLSCVSIYLNNKQEIAEEVSKKKRCSINPGFNHYNESSGVIAGTIALGMEIPIGTENDANFCIAGIGHAMRSFSHYIMRLENTPRKKSIFRRAFEYLYTSIPAARLQPKEARIE